MTNQERIRDLVLTGKATVPAKNCAFCGLPMGVYNAPLILRDGQVYYAAYHTKCGYKRTQALRYKFPDRIKEQLRVLRATLGIPDPYNDYGRPAL